MFLFRWPASLWFLGAGNTAVGSAEFTVSATYGISASVGNVSSVDFEVSAIAYNLSAIVIHDEDDGDIRAGIDLDDNAFSSLDLKASVTPIFQLDQFGITEICASVNYKLSAVIGSASIGYNVTPSVTYFLSASLSSFATSAEIFSVSADYKVSASITFELSKTLGLLEIEINGDYGISASVTPILVVPTPGGLAWSRKKQRYIPVRVGEL